MDLSEYRLDKAKEDLETAEENLNQYITSQGSDHSPVVNDK